MSMVDRRVVNIFKTFIQKVFVPQLNKMDFSCLQEWNKFSNIISSQQLNLTEMQIYVDSISSTSSSFGTINNLNSLNNSSNTSPSNNININSMNFNKQNDRGENKSPLFSKVRKEGPNEGVNSGGFNPSRTFGGQRARVMFPLKDFQDTPTADKQNYNFSKDFSKNKDEVQNSFSTQTFLPTLQRLFKVFSENQNKLQKIGTPSQATTFEQKSYYN